MDLLGTHPVLCLWAKYSDRHQRQEVFSKIPNSDLLSEIDSPFSDDTPMLIVQENVNGLTKCFCCQQRPLDFTAKKVIDCYNEEKIYSEGLIRLTRPLRCHSILCACYLPCYFFRQRPPRCQPFCCNLCLNTLNVESPPGTIIARVKEE